MKFEKPLIRRNTMRRTSNPIQELQDLKAEVREMRRAQDSRRIRWFHYVLAGMVFLLVTVDFVELLWRM